MIEKYERGEGAGARALLQYFNQIPLSHQAWHKVVSTR